MSEKFKFPSSHIEGVQTWDSLEFLDSRGSLFKPFGSNLENEIDLTFTPKEIFFTKSHKGVCRGMHLQEGEHKSRKIVSVISGSVIDLLFDTRLYSPTYMNLMVMNLNTIQRKAILIPNGVAHGYLVTDDDTVVMYVYDNIFCIQCDTGFHVSSIVSESELKYFGTMSPKDINLPSLQTFLSHTSV